MIWFLAVVLIVIAGPFAAESLRRPMNAAARLTAPGKFATLSQGVTHYQWHGPEGGPVVVLIHGLTTPSFVWGGITKVLVASGHRVLSYDHYGRGYSDRPQGLQDRAFFLRQLNDLLAHEGVEGKLTVVGYSMGGAVATCFASAHPERTRQLILLAPAGMQAITSGIYAFIKNTPVIGDWLVFAAYPYVLRKGLRAERELPGSVPGINDLQLAELRYRGFLPAVLSSLRGLLPDPLIEDHKTIAAHKIPVIAIWGREDDVITLTASERLAEWNPDARQEIIDGAGHGLTYTHTDQLMRLWGQAATP